MYAEPGFRDSNIPARVNQLTPAEIKGHESTDPRRNTDAYELGRSYRQHERKRRKAAHHSPHYIPLRKAKKPEYRRQREQKHNELHREEQIWPHRPSAEKIDDVAHRNCSQDEHRRPTFPRAH